MSTPEGTLRERTPEPRCHECQDVGVMAVCCQCHRLLCSTHDVALPSADMVALVLRALLPRRGRRRVTEGDEASGGETSGSGTAESPTEYSPTQVLLVTEGRAPELPSDRWHFCAGCRPWDHWSDRVLVAGGVAALLGVATMPFGLVLTVVAAVAVSVRFVRAARRGRRRRDLRPIVAIDPHVRRVQITETLAVRARWGAQDGYTEREGDDDAASRTLSGLIEIDAAWGRAHTHLLRDLLRRPSRMRRAGTVDAGYVLLRGGGEVVLPETDGQHPEGSRLLRLEPSLADHPMLTTFESRGDARWPLTVEYAVCGTQALVPGDRVNLWLVPTMVPKSGGRALTFDIAWDTRGDEPDPDGSPLPITKLDLLRVEVPGEWVLEGLTSTPRPTVRPPTGGGPRTVEWRNILLRESTRGRHRVTLRFADTIDASATITGRVEARFRGSVSGVTGVTVHDAGGHQRGEGVEGEVGRGGLNARSTTCVHLDVSVELANLRHQELLSLPNRHEQDADGRTGTIHFPGVAPHHEMVAALADELGRQEYYVKRLVENPPQPGRRAGNTARSWDIGGRRYDGIYPIDFQLVVSGEESTGDDASSSGTTRATLSVSGTYATDDMELRVRDEWDTLWGHVRRVLSGLHHAAPALPSAGAGDDDLLLVVERARSRGDISDVLAAELTTRIGKLLSSADGAP